MCYSNISKKILFDCNLDVLDQKYDSQAFLSLVVYIHLFFLCADNMGVAVAIPRPTSNFKETPNDTGRANAHASIGLIYFYFFSLFSDES